MMTERASASLTSTYALLIDSRKWYLEGSDLCEDEGIRQLLFALSRERAMLEGELMAQLRTLAPAAIASDGTASGSVRRGWTTFKDALGLVDNAAILEECELGENTLLASYATILEQGDLDPEMEGLLVAHQAKIQANVDRVHELREIRTGPAH